MTDRMLASATLNRPPTITGQNNTTRFEMVMAAMGKSSVISFL
jgi:hypothetical protein